MMAIGVVVVTPVTGRLNAGVRSVEFCEFGALSGAAVAVVKATIIASVFFPGHRLKRD